jgi:hypothetical protein
MKIRFGNNVNQEAALLAYGDFIYWIKETSNSLNIFFGYYVDGEPFCSGSFGEVRYSQFINK